MRKGWEYKSFETCINKLPKAKQVKTSEYSSGTKYPIISQEDKLISGYYDDDSYVFHIDSPVVIFGDHTRVLKYVDFDFVVGADGVKIISPQKELNAKFLLYYLQWYKIPNLGYSRHYKLLKEINIPLPPKSTQLAIVSELDKINELIRLKKEQLKDFDNLAQSLFYEMFGDPVENEKGWEVKKLGEIGEFKNGLNFSKDENGHSIKFLGVSDFQNKKSITSDQLDYISLSECVQEDYLLKTGDIVFVRSNGKKELIGRSVKMYISEPTTYSGFCIRCRITDEKVDKDYIAILLKTPIIRQLMTNSGRGCNISNLNQKVLNSIPIILPPLSLQRLFAQRIEQIEREKSEVQKSIQDLETLLASRMQYWFE